MDISGIDLSGIIALASSLITTWGLKVVGAIVVLLVGRWAAGWARKLVRKLGEKIELDPTLTPFLASLAYYAVIAMVLVVTIAATAGTGGMKKVSGTRSAVAMVADRPGMHPTTRP